jgi:hypothetical protein
LRAGQATALGVVKVWRSWLDQATRQVRIEVRALQVGDDNRQLNEIQVFLQDVTADVSTLDERPVTAWALDKIAENPGNPVPWLVLRCLPDGGPLLAGQDPVAGHGTGGHVTLRGAAGPGVLVTGADAIQHGDHSTQRNKFRDDVDNAELNLRAAAQGSIKVALAVATLRQHPEDTAAMATLIEGIRQEVSALSGEAGETRANFNDQPVTAYSAQVGEGNARRDTILVTARQCTITGLPDSAPDPGSPWQPAPPLPGAPPLQEDAPPAADGLAPRQAGQAKDTTRDLVRALARIRPADATTAVIEGPAAETWTPAARLAAGQGRPSDTIFLDPQAGFALRVTAGPLPGSATVTTATTPASPPVDRFVKVVFDLPRDGDGWPPTASASSKTETTGSPAETLHSNGVTPRWTPS